MFWLSERDNKLDNKIDDKVSSNLEDEKTFLILFS
jgi:hypothetical protein